MANLLNPCHCTTGGPCKCCQPKRERADSVRGLSPSSSGARTPTHAHVTDGLIEMFKTKATTNTPEGSSCCSFGPSRPSITTTPTWNQLMSPKDSYLSPENMHHPAHTSPHVHKTKLYSPYSTSGHTTPRHGRREPSSSAVRGSGWASSSSSRPALPKLRPISDMNKLLGAVFRDDGTVNDQIPRSALGLPGIKAFDTMAEIGGVEIEAMEMEVDVPLQFPTNEDVVIGACGCGDDCDCPNCATHPNPARVDETHRHDGCCGDHCKSSFDCSDHLSLPRGITSIGHLLSLAAANVPPPTQKRPVDLNAHAHDTRVLPPSAHLHEDAARSLGLVTLKPLECCNGRCQCAPGKCVCEKDCCGCCIRCACDEDGASEMNGVPPPTEKPTAKSCCSTTDAQAAPNAQARASSCGSSTVHQSPATSNTATPPLISPSGIQPSSTPPLQASDAHSSRQHSPHPPNTAQASALRRASSTSQTRTPSAPSSRRATVTQSSGIQRSGSTGKQSSKALALHTTPHHPTHRPILPKPPSHGNQLGVPKSGNPSRVPSPGTHGRPAVSQQNSTHASPAIGATSSEIAPQPLRLPESAVQIPSMVNVPPLPDFTASFDPNNMFDQQQPFDQNLDQIFAPPPATDDDYVMDDELLAFINQFTADNGSVGSGFNQPPSSDGSIDQPLVTPDLSFDNQAFDMGHPNGRSNGNSFDTTNADDDFFTLLNNAMQNNSTAGPSSQQYPQPYAQPVNANPVGQTMVQSQAPSAWPLVQAPHQNGSMPQHTAAQVGMRSPLHLTGDTRNHDTDVDNTGFASGLVDLFVGQQLMANASAAQEQAPEPVYRQLPPQQTAFLQQMLGNDPQFAPTTANNNPAQQTGSDQGLSNMIDLSKPLNANDVERILRALQDQQAKTVPQTTPAPPNPSGQGLSMTDHPVQPSRQQQQQQLPPTRTQQQYQPQQQYIQPPPIQQSLKGGLGQPNLPVTNGLSYDMASMNPFGTTEDLFDKYLSHNTSGQGIQINGVGNLDDFGSNGGGGVDFTQLWSGDAGTMDDGAVDPRLNPFVFDTMRRGSGV